MSHQPAGDVIYGPLQVPSRLRPADRVVTVHFSVKGLPEQHFVLTPDAARELAIQLMRHSKRIRRANPDPRQACRGDQQRGDRVLRHVLRRSPPQAPAEQASQWK
jgi:hypothetical protein